MFGERLKLVLNAFEEGWFLDEVARRVAGEREFGERDDVGVGGCGAFGELEHEASVAGEVADGGIDLSQCDFHK